MQLGQNRPSSPMLTPSVSPASLLMPISFPCLSGHNLSEAVWGRERASIDLKCHLEYPSLEPGRSVPPETADESDLE